MVIEILAFAGCPNADLARSNVREALLLEGLGAQIVEIEVETPELAMSHKFLGSPSVRVNGADVEHGAEVRHGYGLMCRTYNEGTTVSGAPGIDTIRRAIGLRNA